MHVIPVSETEGHGGHLFAGQCDQTVHLCSYSPHELLDGRVGHTAQIELLLQTDSSTCVSSARIQHPTVYTVKPELGVTSIKQLTCLKKPNRMFPNSETLIFYRYSPPLSSHLPKAASLCVSLGWLLKTKV